MAQRPHQGSLSNGVSYQYTRIILTSPETSIQSGSTSNPLILSFVGNVDIDLAILDSFSDDVDMKSTSQPLVKRLKTEI